MIAVFYNNVYTATFCFCRLAYAPLCYILRAMGKIYISFWNTNTFKKSLKKSMPSPMAASRIQEFSNKSRMQSDFFTT